MMCDCPHTDCPASFDSTQKLAVHNFSAHVRTRTPKAIDHGSVAGYQAHRRQDDQPCPECRKAWREYYSKKREKPSSS